jgi:peptidoglycan/LPS O-acetylase OafA/YrhL
MGWVPLKLSHFWSLAVEEQFYIAWPWALYLVRGQRRKAQWMCAAIFLLSFGYRLAMVHYACDPMIFWGTTFARAGEFAAGGWLALAMRGPQSEKERVMKLAAPVALLTLAGFCAFDALRGTQANVPNYLWGVTLTAPLFAALIAQSIGKNPVQRVMQMRWLRRVGVISYGLYVYHVLFSNAYAEVASRLTAMVHGGRNAGLGIRFVVAAVLTYALAELSYRYMEKPFLRLKNRWARTPDRSKVSELMVR